MDSNNECIEFCQACLSTDRNLFPLRKLKTILRGINIWELKERKGGVCWECRGLIIKFFRFKARIREAQELLNNYEKPENLSTLSSLSGNRIHFYDQYYSHCYIRHDKKSAGPKQRQQVLSLRFDDDSEGSDDGNRYGESDFGTDVDNISTRSDEITLSKVRNVSGTLNQKGAAALSLCQQNTEHLVEKAEWEAEKRQDLQLAKYTLRRTNRNPRALPDYNKKGQSSSHAEDPTLEMSESNDMELELEDPLSFIANARNGMYIADIKQERLPLIRNIESEARDNQTKINQTTNLQVNSQIKELGCIISIDPVHTQYENRPDKTDAILENQQTMIENQHLILENQQTILMKFDARTIPMQETPDSGSWFAKIDSLESLQKFENILEDPNKKIELKRRFSMVCDKRIGQGLNSAYVLIDYLFTRTFLTKCSWSGGSRGDSSKVPFAFYKNTINFFFELVRDTDETFRLESCHHFLKLILRNSFKRSISKCLRASSTKNRRKKVKSNENQRENEKECQRQETIES